MPRIYPYTINIHFPTGAADGICLVEKSNWSGRGMVCPERMLLENLTREDFGRAGIYILEGGEVSGKPDIYIGEADPVGERILMHQRQKDFWTRAIIFTSKDSSLNKAHVKYLEARLISTARSVKRANLLNKILPNLPTLSDMEKADVETFLDVMLSILPNLGLMAFTKPLTPADGKLRLKIQKKNVIAYGRESHKGFLVFQGSQAVRLCTRTFWYWMSEHRAQLIRKGVLVESGDAYLFSEDCLFKSPSWAAGAILGYNASGQTAWVDDQGRTLKELKQSASG